MYELLTANQRGTADFGWLKANYSFSFANYFNPRQMGFRKLLVINQDTVSPKAGFPPHPHNDMEILTYVIRGSIRHQDSLGNNYVLNAGEIQVMSAGTGVRHSEYNASDTEELELLQIWILTDKENHAPAYDQKNFSPSQKINVLKQVAGPYGSDAPLKIHQDVYLFTSSLKKDKFVSYTLKATRYGWIQVVKGTLNVEVQDESQAKEFTLNPGDGVKLKSGLEIKITSLSEDSDFLFFDLN
jgi:quercetin 2,3-dioxygenase